MFQRVLCVYPYRKDLKKFRFIPPLGLEFIGKVIGPYAQALDIIDLRYESKSTSDFLRPEPDVIRKMELAGFAMLLLGIESAQDKTLHSMRKGFIPTRFVNTSLCLRTGQ